MAPHLGARGPAWEAAACYPKRVARTVVVMACLCALAHAAGQRQVVAGQRAPAVRVLLFAPPLAEDGPRRFQPLLCAIDGKLAVGVRCGEVMPARAVLGTPAGKVAVARSTRPFHDEAGEQDFPAPYGPACCMYNTCIGRTVPYTAARARRDPRPQLAVWPADADLGLVPAPDGVAGVEVPVGPSERVTQAFARGARVYAVVRGRFGGAVRWNLGAGWTTAAATPGAPGATLLATTDVDGDGHLELISFERWPNDYGVDVYGEEPAPLYAWSCGNI
jgi:hypothetical protein